MAVGQPDGRQATSNGGIDAEDAMNGQPLGDKSLEENVWDEERLEKALKVLKEMHIQLRGLRTTIPRLIGPLTAKHPSPESLFRDFSASANTANQEVQQFRRLMADDESTKVLEYARKSRTENPTGIKPWRVTEHPDWLTRDA